MRNYGLLLSLVMVGAVSIGCGEPTRDERIQHLDKQSEVLADSLGDLLKVLASVDAKEAKRYKEAQHEFTAHRAQVLDAFKQFYRDCDEADLPVVIDTVDLLVDISKDFKHKIVSSSEEDIRNWLESSVKARFMELAKRVHGFRPKQKSMDADRNFKARLARMGIKVSMNEMFHF